MYEYNSRVIKVVDGDTLDIEIDLGFDVTIKQRVRLNGIDTPETKTKNKEEKLAGLRAKKITEDCVKGAKIVVVKTHKDDKYGRILVDLIADGINLNERLVNEGFAWKYDGGTKDKDLTQLVS